MNPAPILRYILRVTSILFGGILIGMSIAAPDHMSTPWPQGLVTILLLAGISVATIGTTQLLFGDDDEATGERSRHA